METRKMTQALMLFGLICLFLIVGVKVDLNTAKDETEIIINTKEETTTEQGMGFGDLLANTLQATDIFTSQIEEKEVTLVSSSYEDALVEVTEEPEIEEVGPEDVVVEEADDGIKYVTASYLNVRAEANADSAIVEVLTYGLKISIVGKVYIYRDNEVHDFWYHIQYNDIDGYVNADYLTDEPIYISLGDYMITYYCPCAKCCGVETGITASGAYVQEGVTIAADSSIPFGTQLMIDGHVYTVQDRGGAIRGNHIDIYVNSHQEALNHSVHYAEVFLVQ